MKMKTSSQFCVGLLNDDSLELGLALLVRIDLILRNEPNLLGLILVNNKSAR